MNANAFDRQTLWLLGLCPALAVSDTVVNALCLGVAVTIVSIVAFATRAVLRRSSAVIRWALTVLVLATTVSGLDLIMNAWLHELHQTLWLFVALLVANAAILWRAEQSSPLTLTRAALTGLRMGATLALLLLTLAIARELVGHGSILHGASTVLGNWAQAVELQLFRADMGFLLAMLPPGAFIAFGLLLALRNWLQSRLSHEQTQDR